METCLGQDLSRLVVWNAEFPKMAEEDKAYREFPLSAIPVSTGEWPLSGYLCGYRGKNAGLYFHTVCCFGARPVRREKRSFCTKELGLNVTGSAAAKSFFLKPTLIMAN